MALRFAGALLAQREQPAKTRIGRPVGWIDEERHAIGEVEAATDDQAYPRRLGCLMSAHDSSEAVTVDDPQPFDSQDRGLGEELVAGARAAQEAEMRGALQ